MEIERKQYTRRIRNLVFIFVITAILVSVSTYAWFIGMRTVNIEEFDVEVAGTESLWLSIDGVNFGPTVTINKSNYATAYTGNTNTWGGDEGLIPVSSIGVINQTSARLELYEKASLTPSPGGFRLIASKVENDDSSEQDGYIAFDLFIRNFTGNKYYENYDEAIEEAIYLTVDSAVKVSDTDGVEGTGIENSVRVAFAQIGRVSGDSKLGETIAGGDIIVEEGTKYLREMACKDVLVDGDGEIVTEPESGQTYTKVATGICNHNRPAIIWEPNDVNHVNGAISYYNTACRSRKNGIITETNVPVGEDVTDTESYTTSDCGKIIDGLAYPTYAINSVIDADDNVDIYDGAVYNGYTHTTKLSVVDTFTDSEKLREGMDRPIFMKLAPNSITKVRVYVWIEGQDIDNYDFAQIGKAITVKFGFTKQRFTEDDALYTGPNTNQGEGPSGEDKNPPVITIAGYESGSRVINVAFGGSFTAPAATAVDNVDGTIAGNDIEVINKVNTSVPGTYTVIYRVSDSAGNL
ncbi:MAG: DUF5011 domain-containing protein, partial [Mollicutes bacterium]|nr:DUF5011 domain-containing protein [Mollicutes bacterium]